MDETTALKKKCLVQRETRTVEDRFWKDLLSDPNNVPPLWRGQNVQNVESSHHVWKMGVCRVSNEP